MSAVWYVLAQHQSVKKQRSESEFYESTYRLNSFGACKSSKGNSRLSRRKIRYLERRLKINTKLLLLGYCVFVNTKLFVPIERGDHQIAPCIVGFIFHTILLACLPYNWSNDWQIPMIQTREQVMFDLVVQAIRQTVPN